MVQKVSGHDAVGLWEGDCIDLYLAPDPAAPAKAFQVIVAPDGSVYDADFGAFGNNGARWDLAGLRVRSQVGPECWTVELAMPLENAGVAAAATGMAGNVYRRRMADGDDRFANWSPTLLFRNYSPELFGQMVFMA